MSRKLARVLIGTWLCAGIPFLASASDTSTAPSATSSTATPATPAMHGEYRDDEIVKSASDFFSNGAHELSDVLAKVLKEKGRPIAIIRGEEVSGAVAAGLRY